MTINLKSLGFQKVRMLRRFMVVFLSFVAVIAVFAAPVSGWPFNPARRAAMAERDHSHEASPVGSANLSPTITAPMATPRIITAVIQSFERLKVTINRTENFPSGIGTPFNYRLSVLVARGATVTNITVTPTGGGTCNVQANLDISCSGTLTSLVIKYKYSYIPDMNPPHLTLNIGGSDTTSVNYTLNIVYPSTLTYVSANPLPDSHTPATRSLVWTKSAAYELMPAIRFYAMDLYGVWLPLIIK